MEAALELGFETRLYCLTSGEYWENIYKKTAIPIKSSPLRGRLGRTFFLYNEWRHWQPDIVFCLHFYSAAYTLPLRPFLNFRLIVGVRNNGVTSLTGLPGILTRLILANSSALAVNSRSGIENLIKSGIGERQMFYLPNVVQRINQLPCSKAPIVLVVGRLVQVKRIDRALEIVSTARKTLGNSFKCHILGDGPLRKTLEEYNLAVGANAEFLGIQDDLTTHYQHAAVVLLTSDHEGTPNVILEAMTHRCAVLATSVGELPNLLQNGLSALLFSTDSISAGAACLIQLLTNETLREYLTYNAWNTLDAFCLQNLKKNMKEMIENVLEKRYES